MEKPKKTAFVLLAVFGVFTAFAEPLQWVCDWPETRSQTFSLYQGEAATFEPVFRINGEAATNIEVEAVWYQTNGMGAAWWRLDAATFAPSNDCGAAAYRFFVDARRTGAARETDSRIYRANGTLRMLPSPGFAPNIIPMPVDILDFAVITVANAPYFTKQEVLDAISNALVNAVFYDPATSNLTYRVLDNPAQE